MSDNPVQMLRKMADEIMRVDGDRDHMNNSDLTVEQTLACAGALRVCADELEHAEKVWVLYDHVRFEGCGPPLALYSTAEAAEQDRERRQTHSMEDQTYFIKEMTVLPHLEQRTSTEGSNRTAERE